MAVFFLIGLAVLWSTTLTSRSAEKQGSLGGPVDLPPPQKTLSDGKLALVVSQPGIMGLHGTASGAPRPYAPTVAVAALADRGQPIGSFAIRPGLLIYKVKKGDNLSRIAANFGITVSTIVGANPQVRGKSLQIGEELKILPATGVLYQVRDGDTLESVADLFGIRPDQIQDYNRSVNFGTLASGVSLLIPGGKISLAALRGGSSLPNLNGYFIQPTDGYNWGNLHAYNAVDISNNCGTSIKAAAEGLVVPDDRYGDGADGWNGGYGTFILIEHPNDTKTRYAHLNKTLVSIGDYVKQGQEIGEMGNTGNTHGPTGCHLHFEVYNAQNPFSK